MHAYLLGRCLMAMDRRNVQCSTLARILRTLDHSAVVAQFLCHPSHVTLHPETAAGLVHLRR